MSQWDVNVNDPSVLPIDARMSFVPLWVAMNTPKLTIGRRLAWAREDAGITVNQMADRLGIDRRTVTRYERGGCRVPEAVLIAYQVICDVPEDFIRGRAYLTQEVVRSRCTGERPLFELRPTG